jgi:hypothetical protein
MQRNLTVEDNDFKTAFKQSNTNRNFLEAKELSFKFADPNSIQKSRFDQFFIENMSNGGPRVGV